MEKTKYMKPYRLAAVGDLHCSETSAGSYRYTFEDLNLRADVLVLCGDLTRRGKMAEIEVVIENLAEVRIPVLAVLGNHDYHENNNHHFHDRLEAAGVTVMDGDPITLTINDRTVGFAGVKGFAGGFGPRALPDFGEAMWRAFYRETMAEADKLRRGLAALETDLKIAALHYSPILSTLTGEDPQIYAFMGSSELAKAIDAGGADLALHSHAHFGREMGRTPGGVPVYNVSEPLIGRSYAIFELEFPRR